MKFDLPRDNDAFRQYTGWDFELSHEGIDFQVSTQEIEGIAEEDELSHLKEVVSRILAQKETAVDKAADGYFESFLTKWNRDEPISREEFKARLRPGTISIGSDRSVSLELEDEHDMFWGHAIVVHFDRNLQIHDTELAG
ncbi:DUF2262 domain-containing protein [Actomonas aquatica]|uniref:DUF2262 domain-containing protein n=1 Tax=Actomonas aquatica TaxID=2866162 RepID=A0ABZ1C8D8_9BACT|nr:DUF2262 domain-containing protein [Opitutus sp. WL0086]WRQ87771.1 DUF2262 domain-containing protein [Opitutus sp. WL0086]